MIYKYISFIHEQILFKNRCILEVIYEIDARDFQLVEHYHRERNDDGGASKT